MGVATGRRGYYNPIWQTGDIVASPPPPLPPPQPVLTFFKPVIKYLSEY